MSNDIDLDLDSFDDGMDELDNLSVDFGEMEPTPPANKREAVTRTVKDTAKGFISNYDDPLDVADEVINNAIPKEISGELSDINSTVATTKSMFKESAKELRYEGRQALTNIENMLPKDGVLSSFTRKIADHFGDDSRPTGEPSREELQDQHISEQLSSIFNEKYKLDKVDDMFSQIVDNNRHKDNISLLSGILANTRQSRDFDIEVSNGYYRKSLELQFKSLFINKESLEVTKEAFTSFRNQFESIIKNTSLPDLVKLNNSEQLQETLESRLRESISDGIQDIFNPFDNIKKNIVKKSKEITSGINSGLSGFNSAADANASVDDMGMSKAELASMMLSGQLNEYIGGKLGDLAGKNDYTKEQMFKFKDTVSDLKSFADKKSYDRTYNEDGDEKLISKLSTGLFKQLSGLMNSQQIETLELINKNPDALATMDNRFKDTVIKTIPGLLSKIHAEQKALRLGNNPDDNELYFNNKTNRLETKLDIKDGFQNEIEDSIKNNLPYVLDGLTNTILNNSSIDLDVNEQKEFYKGIIDYIAETNRVNPTALLDEDHLNKYDKELRDKLTIGISDTLNEARDDLYILDKMHSNMSSIMSNIPDSNNIAKELHAQGLTDISNSLGLTKLNRSGNGYTASSEKSIETAKNVIDTMIDDEFTESVNKVKESKAKEKEEASSIKDTITNNLKTTVNRTKDYFKPRQKWTNDIDTDYVFNPDRELTFGKKIKSKVKNIDNVAQNIKKDVRDKIAPYYESMTKDPTISWSTSTNDSPLKPNTDYKEFMNLKDKYYTLGKEYYKKGIAEFENLTKDNEEQFKTIKENKTYQDFKTYTRKTFNNTKSTINKKYNTIKNKPLSEIKNDINNLDVVSKFDNVKDKVPEFKDTKDRINVKLKDISNSSFVNDIKDKTADVKDKTFGKEHVWTDDKLEVSPLEMDKYESGVINRGKFKDLSNSITNGASSVNSDMVMSSVADKLPTINLSAVKDREELLNNINFLESENVDKEGLTGFKDHLRRNATEEELNKLSEFKNVLVSDKLGDTFTAAYIQALPGTDKKDVFALNSKHIDYDNEHTPDMMTDLIAHEHHHLKQARDKEFVLPLNMANSEDEWYSSMTMFDGDKYRQARYTTPFYDYLNSPWEEEAYPVGFGALYDKYVSKGEIDPSDTPKEKWVNNFKKNNFKHIREYLKSQLPVYKKMFDEVGWKWKYDSEGRYLGDSDKSSKGSLGLKDVNPVAGGIFTRSDSSSKNNFTKTSDYKDNNKSFIDKTKESLEGFKFSKSEKTTSKTDSTPKDFRTKIDNLSKQVNDDLNKMTNNGKAKEFKDTLKKTLGKDYTKDEINETVDKMTDEKTPEDDRINVFKRFRDTLGSVNLKSNDIKSRTLGTLFKDFKKTYNDLSSGRTIDVDIDEMKEYFFSSSEYQSGMVTNFDEWLSSLGIQYDGDKFIKINDNKFSNMKNKFDKLKEEKLTAMMDMLDSKDDSIIDEYKENGLVSVLKNKLNPFKSLKTKNFFKMTRALDRKIMKSIPKVLGKTLSLGGKGIKTILGTLASKKSLKNVWNASKYLVGMQPKSEDGEDKESDEDTLINKARKLDRGIIKKTPKFFKDVVGGVASTVTKVFRGKKKDARDVDGDGDIDGSWRDIINDKKNKKKQGTDEKDTNIKDAKEDKNNGLLGMLKGMFTKFSPLLVGLLGAIKSLPGMIGGALGGITTAISKMGTSLVSSVAGVKVAKDAMSKKTKSETDKGNKKTKTKGNLKEKINKKKPSKEKIMSKGKSFKNKIIKKFGKKGGAKLLGKLTAKLAARAVPVLGLALLAYDATMIAKDMIMNDTDLDSAISKQLIGIDLFKDDVMTDDGEIIKPDEPKERETDDKTSTDSVNKPRITTEQKEKLKERYGSSRYDSYKYAQEETSKIKKLSGGQYNRNPLRYPSRDYNTVNNSNYEPIGYIDRTSSLLSGGSFSDYPESKEEVLETIDDASKVTGIDSNRLKIFAALESDLNPKAKAKTSSASGLFQFIKSTWDGMVNKYGKKYDISREVSPFDPMASSIMGAEYIKENENALKSVKDDITTTDLYLAHFLGPGGARKFLKADPSTIAAGILPKAARANKSIFFKKSGMPRTTSDIYDLFQNKILRKAKYYGFTKNDIEKDLNKEDETTKLGESSETKEVISTTENISKSKEPKKSSGLSNLDRSKLPDKKEVISKQTKSVTKDISPETKRDLTIKSKSNITKLDDSIVAEFKETNKLLNETLIVNKQQLDVQLKMLDALNKQSSNQQTNNTTPKDNTNNNIQPTFKEADLKALSSNSENFRGGINIEKRRF